MFKIHLNNKKTLFLNILYSTWDLLLRQNYNYNKKNFFV